MIFVKYDKTQIELLFAQSLQIICGVYGLKTKLTVYNSVHCVTNCTEAENESKHKKATATCYII